MYIPRGRYVDGWPIPPHLTTENFPRASSQGLDTDVRPEKRGSSTSSEPLGRLTNFLGRRGAAEAGEPQIPWCIPEETVVSTASLFPDTRHHCSTGAIASRHHQEADWGSRQSARIVRAPCLCPAPSDRIAAMQNQAGRKERQAACLTWRRAPRSPLRRTPNMGGRMGGRGDDRRAHARSSITCPVSSPTGDCSWQGGGPSGRSWYSTVFSAACRAVGGAQTENCGVAQNTVMGSG
jgi:hypothetical protein